MCVQRPVVRTDAHDRIPGQQGRAVTPQVESALRGGFADAVLTGEGFEESFADLRPGQQDGHQKSAAENRIVQRGLADDKERDDRKDDRCQHGTSGE